MADVSGKFFSAKKVRTGVSPSSPGVEQGETLPPVNPPGSDLNSVGLSMPSAFNVANSPLTSNGTIAVTGAGTTAQYIRGDGSLASFPSLTGYVPYTGATQNVDLGEFGLDTGFVNLDTTPTNTPTTQGTIYWDDSKSTAALIMNGTTQHIGQDTYFYVKNSTGSSIAKGTAVRFDGTDGASGHLLIAPFLADGTYPSAYFMGVTAEAIGNGGFGQVTNFGEIEGINTSGYTAGALLYASTTVAGGFQTTAPVAPNNIVLIAAAVNSKNNGAIIVRPQIGSNINNDEGVKITSPTTGQLLQLQSNGLWENKTKAQVLGGTSSQFVKGDGSLDSTAYVPTSRQVIAGAGLTGGGALTANVNLSHADTSSQASVDNSNGNVIQDVTLDTYGHITALGSTNLDNRYYTETEIDTTLTNYQLRSEKGQPSGYASLDSNGKVPLTEINDALIGNVNYQGLWNASTNTPTLANPPSSGTKGYYYIVSTAGTFASISFEVGDWIISNGSAWQKVDNTDAVSSVFGRTGNVVAANGDYNTSQVTENTNLYFTQARVSANTDVAANTAARHNAVTLGTANGLSLNVQQLSLQLASGSTTGALSSANWTTFNNKENAITAGTTAQYFRGDKTFQTLNTAAVTESTNLYFTNARAIASVLTGYTSGAGTISATDSILSAIQKLNGNIGALVTGVSSVFGRTGAVVAANGDYTTAQVTESGNLYFTTARVLATALTGYTVGTNTALAATDTILGAFGKVQAQINAKQNALNGTGFVKIAGTTISYDNTSYLPLTGGTLTGTLNGTTAVFSNTVTGYQGIFKDGSEGLIIGYYTGGNGYGAIYASSLTINNSNYALIAKSDNTILNAPTGGSVNVSIGNTPRLTIASTGAATFTSSVEATSIIRTGGTSSQYLMADGSVSTLTNPVTGTGTAGQVAYWSSGSEITGESNLFWDATNDRLGIGTASPAGILNVAGSNAAHGTTGIPTIPTLLLFRSTSSASNYAGLEIETEVVGSNFGLYSNQNGALFYHGGTERWRITSTGVYQSNGAQTIQTSTGNLTLATAAGNGNIVLSPNGTGISLIENTVVGNIATFKSNTANGQQLNISSTATGVQIRSLFNTGITGSFDISASGGNSTLSFGTASTERMRITSGGNVGIGTDSPAAKLQVEDSANNIQMRVGSLTAGINPIIRFQGKNVANTTNRYADIKLDADLGVFTLMAPATVGPTVNALNIITGGNVGIGTASPTNLIHGYVSSGSIVTVLKLENASVTASSGTAISFTEGGTERAKIVSQIGTGTTPYLAFENNGSERIRIFSDGNTFIGSSASNAGYKLDVNGTGRFSGSVSTPVSLTLSSANSNCDITMQSANSSSVSRIRNGTNDLQFHTNGTLALTLASNQAATFSSSVTATNAVLNTPSDGIALILNGRSSDNSTSIRFNSNVGALNNFISSTPSNLIIGSQGNTPISFVTNNAVVGTAAMTIRGDGNVLIGTINDNSNKLRVEGQVFINANTQLDSKTTTGVGSSNVAIANFSNAEGSTYHITATDGTNYYRAILIGVQNVITVANSTTSGTVPSRSFVISSNILNMSITSGTWTVKCTQIRTV